MRCLCTIILVIFLSLITLSPPHMLAGEVYIWTDTGGVVHITDNPRDLPPGVDVETVHHRDENIAERQSLADEKQEITPAEEDAEGTEAVSGRNKELSEKEPRRKGLEEKLKQAREEYDRAKDLVEKRRRQSIRKRNKRSRDSFKHALEELGEKREKLRELERQN